MTHIFRLYWLSVAFAVPSLTLSPSFKISTKSPCSLTFNLWTKSPWWCYSSNETAFKQYFRMVRFSQCFSKGDFKLIFIMNLFFKFWCSWQFIVQRNYWLKVIEKKNVRISHFKRFPSKHYMLGNLADKGFYSAWHKANFALMVWILLLYFTHGAKLQG